jgi:hypothetical protein
MKHLHIHSLEFKEENPLIVWMVMPYDETNPNYDPQTKQYVEKNPFDKITYVNVEDDVDVNVNDIATKNHDNTWTFTKPNK